MALDKKSGEIITKEQARTFIKVFKEKYPNEVTAFFVGRTNVEKILNQVDCIGIRIYNGYDTATSKMNQVLLGVNSKEEDMSDGIIIERLYTCPPYCSTASIMEE